MIAFDIRGRLVVDDEVASDFNVYWIEKAGSADWDHCCFVGHFALPF
jgi:hypothetical protein